MLKKQNSKTQTASIHERMNDIMHINNVLGIVKKSRTTSKTLDRYVDEFLNPQTLMEVYIRHYRNLFKIFSGTMIEGDIKQVENCVNLACAIASHPNVTRETLKKLLLFKEWPESVRKEIQQRLAEKS